MHKKLTPLKPAEHKDLRLLDITDYSFARGELIAPIVIDEIADVSREYPIVFPKGAALPVALMGMEENSNAYVGIDGRWLATYIPAHIQHYPFAITRIPDAPAEVAKVDQTSAKGKKTKDKDATATPSKAADERRYAVLLDVESPYVSATSGEPIFDAEDKLRGVAQQKVNIMNLMQNRVGITQRLVQVIDEAGLLIERAIRIRREGEADRQVSGVRVIDEAALNKLDDAAFNQLRAAGALPLVYASLLSWANFRQGPIGKSHPLPAMHVPMDDEVIRFN